MKARFCRFCGGLVIPERSLASVHVCADCQRLLEDDSPMRAVLFSAREVDKPPAHKPPSTPAKRTCPLRHGRFRKNLFPE